MPKIDYARMEALMREGKKDAEIAAILGCAQSSVCKERHRMGLADNVRGKKYRLGDVPQLMDEGEIVRSWRAMRSKVDGIKVLAELNLCSQDVIVDILRRNGCDARKRRTGRERKEAAL